jgi:hypothetical protein
MIKKSLATLNLVFGTTLTAIYLVEVIKFKIQKLADTETVYNERQYVLVKLARGDYNRPNGFETLKYDYKFYKTISRFHD